MVHENSGGEISSLRQRRHIGRAVFGGNWSQTPRRGRRSSLQNIQLLFHTSHKGKHHWNNLQLHHLEAKLKSRVSLLNCANLESNQYFSNHSLNFLLTGPYFFWAMALEGTSRATGMLLATSLPAKGSSSLGTTTSGTAEPPARGSRRSPTLSKTTAIPFWPTAVPWKPKKETISHSSSLDTLLVASWELSQPWYLLQVKLNRNSFCHTWKKVPLCYRSPGRPYPGEPSFQRREFRFGEDFYLRFVVPNLRHFAPVTFPRYQ